MLVVVVLPLVQLLSKSLMDEQDRFVGLANFINYFRTPSLAGSLVNSLYVAGVTTVISLVLGLGFAYALTRTCLPWTNVFLSLAMMPIFAPTLLNGITLVYLFGRKGLVTTGGLGWLQSYFGLNWGWDIGIYGATGIIMAEVIYTFPQVVLILSISLRLTDSRLYEAAESLGATRIRTFFTVTMPSIKYGLISAGFVCFILCFTDFGAPKVVGGGYNVLAVDIYKQVIGQHNFVMGATVGVVLLAPTVLAFVLDRLSQRRQVAVIAAKSVPRLPKPWPWRDYSFLVYCLLVTGVILGFYLTALYASLVNVWPYKLQLTLRHYFFTGMGGGGYTALYNSIRMAFYSAVLGTFLSFFSAYMVEKSSGLRALRQGAYFLSIMPLALPGLVIGLAYIVFFNAPGWTVPVLGWRLPNPFNFLYSTMGILVLSNIVHFYTVSFLTATAALKQLDREFEAISSSMGVPFYATFFRVTVPVCLPAILEIGLYYFVNSMATVSAVIFLYSADLQLASVAVANMDDAGDVAPAAAMSVLIVLINLVVRFLFGLATGGLRKRGQAWVKG
jgi:iron(III) transport system permease protein